MIERESEIHQTPEKIDYHPFLIAFTGPPLMGKSTIGRLLAQKTNIQFHDVDETRWSIFDKTPDQGFPTPLPPSYEQFAMQTSYQANHEHARDDILSGKPAIVAATYSRELYSKMLQDLQEKTNVPLIVFYFDASNDVIEKRLAERKMSGGQSNIQTLEEFGVVMERMQPMEGVEVIRIHTDHSPEETVKEVLSHLQDLRA